MSKNYIVEVDAGRQKATADKYDVRGIAVTGIVQMFLGAVAPGGWLLLDGKSLGKTGSGAYYTGEDYRDLFNVIKGCAPNLGSEDFDAGNTVVLPDMRQRFPLGQAASGTGSTLGGVGGTVDHAHNVNSHNHTGPSHSHDLGSHTHGLGSHQHDIPFRIDGSSYLYYGNLYGTGANQNFGTRVANAGGSAGAVAVLKSAAASGNVDAASGSTGLAGTGVTGSTAPGTDTKNPPFLALNFIVKI